MTDRTTDRTSERLTGRPTIWGPVWPRAPRPLDRLYLCVYAYLFPPRTYIVHWQDPTGDRVGVEFKFRKNAEAYLTECRMRYPNDDLQLEEIRA